MNEPVLVGVPEIFPVEGLRSSPGGNAPLVTPQTRVPMPPVTDTVWLYATLNDPAGRDVVVIVGGAGKPIVIDRGFVAVSWGTPESLTRKVGEDVPAVAGVPLITPDGLRLRPAGNDPLLISHVFPPVPPVEVNVT